MAKTPYEEIEEAAEKRQITPGDVYRKVEATVNAPFTPGADPDEFMGLGITPTEMGWSDRKKTSGALSALPPEIPPGRRSHTGPTIAYNEEFPQGREVPGLPQKAPTSPLANKRKAMDDSIVSDVRSKWAELGFNFPGQSAGPLTDAERDTMNRGAVRSYARSGGVFRDEDLTTLYGRGRTDRQGDTTTGGALRGPGVDDSERAKKLSKGWEDRGGYWASPEQVSWERQEPFRKFESGLDRKSDDLSARLRRIHKKLNKMGARGNRRERDSLSKQMTSLVSQLNSVETTRSQAIAGGEGALGDALKLAVDKGQLSISQYNMISTRMTAEAAGKRTSGALNVDEKAQLDAGKSYNRIIEDREAAKALFGGGRENSVELDALQRRAKFGDTELDDAYKRR